MVIADKRTDKRGMKRLCVNCGTGFYDFNNRPVMCPSCDTEFTGKAKVKSRRGRPAAVANEDKGQIKKVAIAKEKSIENQDDDEIDDADKDVENMIISLDDAADSEPKDDENNEDTGAVDLEADPEEDADMDASDDNKSLEDELKEEGTDGAAMEDND